MTEDAATKESTLRIWVVAAVLLSVTIAFAIFMAQKTETNAGFADGAAALAFVSAAAIGIERVIEGFCADVAGGAHQEHCRQACPDGSLPPGK